MFRKKLRYILPGTGRFRYYNRIRIFGFDRERRIRRTFREKVKIVLDTASETVIPFTDIDITTFCNLRCKRCAKCIPYFRERKHFTAEEIRENLELLTRYIDTVYVANIIGGEPFLNPELPEIINMCDNVCVVRGGHLVGRLSREELSQEEIMKYAAGGVETNESEER